MLVSFKKTDLKDLDSSIQKEWIETNVWGSLSNTSIIGLNSRRKQGLFIYRKSILEEPYLILSQLQEEIILDKKSYPLFNAEYENHPEFKGLEFLEEFELNPFPTYQFKIDSYIIQKSIFLSRDANRLTVRYLVSGSTGRKIRLVIRPILGFRTLNETVNPENFENTEAFLQNNFLRFLPFPEAPEVVMQFTDGEFFNSPTWFHNFFYRMDREPPNKCEDLFNPGFLDVKIDSDKPLYLSFTVGKAELENLENLYASEIEKRRQVLNSTKSVTLTIDFYNIQLQNFQKFIQGQKAFFVTDFSDIQPHFSLHCLVILRLLQSKINKDKADLFLKNLHNYVLEVGLHKFFLGMHPVIKVDAASLFLFIFVIYEYYKRYDGGEEIPQILEMIEELINLIRKNKFASFRLKRNRLLERQYRKSHLKRKEPYELFFPLYQNFILNVFWYNGLCILIDVGKSKNIRYKKYERWCEKLKHNFSNQYMRSFISNPIDGPENYGFAFHPSLIFAITLPFPILNDRENHILYRVLLKQFLDESGLKNPVRDGDHQTTISSSILIGEYLKGWTLLMKDKIYLLEFFQKIAEKISSELKSGNIGYIPNYNQVSSGSSKMTSRASGVASSEVRYFFSLLEQIRQKPADKSK